MIKPESPHVLSGIMEKMVIKHLVKLGFQIETRKVMPDELFSFDQVILTNSLMGAVPILSLDGRWLKEPTDLCRNLCECVL